MTLQPAAQTGTGTRWFHGHIDEDAVAAYARATNDPNPRYQRGEAVPPLFTATLALGANSEAQRSGFDRGAVRAWRASVHGEHDVFFWGRATPGMALQWRATSHSAHSNRGGVILTRRILMTDTDGSPLVEHLWSSFLVGGVIDQDFGPALPDHTFPEDARSRPFATRVVSVDRDQGFRYAGVSGDRAPHAMDDEHARLEGYPRKILQGMCTFGLCAGAIVDVAAGGDPSGLRRLAGRFSAPGFPLKDITVELYDAGRTEEGGRALVFEARQDGATVMKHGRVELLPS